MALAGCAVIPPDAANSSATPGTTNTQAPSATSARPIPIATATPTSKPTATASTPSSDTRKGTALNRPYTVNGVAVVSKKHRISRSYGPEAATGPNHLDATTAAALAKMTKAAASDGVRVVVRSGYRSYSTQKAIYDRALRNYPQNINFYAPPGASEHQTGLAVDLWDGKVWYRPMENSAAGKWLHKHARDYGFILRFPKGRQKITGVPYEPWHFRYVGVAISKQFDAANTLTLEEYLGLA